MMQIQSAGRGFGTPQAAATRRRQVMWGSCPRSRGAAKPKCLHISRVSGVVRALREARFRDARWRGSRARAPRPGAYGAIPASRRASRELRFIHSSSPLPAGSCQGAARRPATDAGRSCFPMSMAHFSDLHCPAQGNCVEGGRGRVTGARHAARPPLGFLSPTWQSAVPLACMWPALVALCNHLLSAPPMPPHAPLPAFACPNHRQGLPLFPPASTHACHALFSRCRQCGLRLPAFPRMQGGLPELHS